MAGMMQGGATVLDKFAYWTQVGQKAPIYSS